MSMVELIASITPSFEGVEVSIKLVFKSYRLCSEFIKVDGGRMVSRMLFVLLKESLIKSKG